MSIERLVEYAAAKTGLTVNRVTGEIRGVRVLGLESKNGRTYPAETLRRAASLYEGARVNVDHAGAGNRSYADRIGTIRGVSLDAGGLRGTLHVNPGHALAEQLFWDAERSPESVGLSHVVEAKTRRVGTRLVVEEIMRVESVDLVADPATARGLHESVDSGRREIVEAVAEEVGYPAWLLDSLVDPTLALYPTYDEIRDYLKQLRESVFGAGRGATTAERARPRLQTADRFSIYDGDGGHDPAAQADFLETATGQRVRRPKINGDAGVVTIGRMTDDFLPGILE